MKNIKKKSPFSEEYEELLKKSHMGYEPSKYFVLCLTAGIFGGLFFAAFFFLISLRISISITFIIGVFFISGFMIFELIKALPSFAVKKQKSLLESDLLYSARHLLLKLESGSSLLNSLESVALLKTNSSTYFKQLVFDVNMGVNLEDAIDKAMEYSPSASYTKLMEELKSSLKTGSDINRTLRSTLQDITRQHLIQIREYGKKLNPMSMFYMIIGTIVPSLGTAMLVVATSFLPGIITIDKRILFFLAFLLLVVQVFFIMAFKSLKPAVMT